MQAIHLKQPGGLDNLNVVETDAPGEHEHEAVLAADQGIDDVFLGPRKSL